MEKFNAIIKLKNFRKHRYLIIYKIGFRQKIFLRKVIILSNKISQVFMFEKETAKY